MTPLGRAKLSLATAALVLAVGITGFFKNLSTATTDYSWGDASYHLQVFHNFISGRPFQTSLYHNPYHGVIDNPSPFASQTAVRVDFTPFLFLPLFALKPTLYTMYLLTILVVMIPTLVAVRTLFKDFLPPGEDRGVRLYAVWAVVLASSLFRLSHYKGHLLLYAAPFFLIMDTAARRRRTWMFLAAAAATALVGEDAALWACSYCAYLWLCDPDFRRPAAAAGAMAGALFAVMTFVLMPAARRGMVLESGSHALFVLAHMEGLKKFPKEAIIALLFAPALAAARLAYDPGPRFTDRRLAALVLIAPASHWFITAANYGGHHLMPVLLCAILALAGLVADGRPAANPARKRAAAACLALYAAVSLLNFSRDFPRPLRAEQAAQSASNRAFIRGVRERVPEDATLVFWSDMGTEAFLADRPCLWRFPEYSDLADYVAVEPSARDSWGVHWPESYKPDLGDQAPVSAEAVALLRRRLAANYQAVQDDPDLLLFQRKTRVPFPVPPSAVGFGYLFPRN